MLFSLVVQSDYKSYCVLSDSMQVVFFTLYYIFYTVQTVVCKNPSRFAVSDILKLHSYNVRMRFRQEQEVCTKVQLCQQS